MVPPSSRTRLFPYTTLFRSLNGSGRSPKAISIEAVKKEGYEKMPKYGWMPVTVPGAPSAWVELSERFGKLHLTEVLRPAIQYAAEGYPLSPTLARCWRRAHRIFSETLKGDKYKAWLDRKSVV